MLLDDKIATKYNTNVTEKASWIFVKEIGLLQCRLFQFG